MFCESETGVLVNEEVGGTARAARCALTSVDDSYLSWPIPAAMPNSNSPLLATTRHAVVLRLKLLTYNESLPLLAAMTRYTSIISVSRQPRGALSPADRKSTRLNSSH